MIPALFDLPSAGIVVCLFTFRINQLHHSSSLVWRRLFGRALAPPSALCDGSLKGLHNCHLSSVRRLVVESSNAAAFDK